MFLVEQERSYSMLHLFSVLEKDWPQIPSEASLSIIYHPLSQQLALVARKIHTVAVEIHTAVVWWFLLAAGSQFVAESQSGYLLSVVDKGSFQIQHHRLTYNWVQSAAHGPIVHQTDYLDIPPMKH